MPRTVSVGAQRQMPLFSLTLSSALSVYMQRASCSPLISSANEFVTGSSSSKPSCHSRMRWIRASGIVSRLCELSCTYQLQWMILVIFQGTYLSLLEQRQPVLAQLEVPPLPRETVLGLHRDPTG